MKIDKGYEYVNKTKGELNDYGGRDNINIYGIKYREILQISKPTKTLVVVGVATLQPFVAFVLSPFLLLFSMVLMVTVLSKVVFGPLNSTTLWSDNVAKNIRKELEECCRVFRKLQIARDMSPEGTGIHARTDEYGRLLFRTMEGLIRLHDANDIMGGSERAFYTEISEMKNILDNLSSSGGSLIEITASQRVNSVKEDLQFLGIDEFNAAVSSETAIFRSLSAGKDKGH